MGFLFCSFFIFDLVSFGPFLSFWGKKKEDLNIIFGVEWVSTSFVAFCGQN